jgi:hypothetical protein
VTFKRSSRIRCHHLLKTFYTGSGGWADKQSPDGTVVWTAPTGRTYSTKPSGSLFFPIWATPTGEAAIRKITAERRINEQILKRQRWLFGELEKHRQSSAADEPPQF